MAKAVHRPAAELARFVTRTDFDDLSEDVVRLVERIFVDTVGVAVAGSAEGAGRTAASAFGALGPDDRGPATVIGHDWRATAPETAFVNGTAAHGLDYDDVAEPMSNHPSTTMVPALLAVGESTDASGTDLIASYVVGYETQYYLAQPIMPDHYEVGWHATSTLGTFGTAAAVAHRLDLSREQCRHALNIAASMPSGLKRNFGSDTKPMHAGMAARAGVTAALLAAHGFSADDDAIAPERGFLDLYTRPHDVDPADLPDLDHDFAIAAAGVHVKKYPCCYFTHTTIEAASRLRDGVGLDASDVAGVTVRTAQGAHDVLHHDDPETGLEGKFSMHYCVAAALATERVDLATFDDETVDDQAIQSIRPLVDFEVDDSLPYASHETSIAVQTTDGEVYERALEAPPGTADNPLSDAELEAKFHECATRRFADSRAERAHAVLDDLRHLETVRDLTSLL